MNFQKLGNSDLLISRIGLGCMGMSEFYGPHDDAVSVAAIDRALDLGLNFLDTADAYGRGQNEELVGQAIRHRARRRGAVDQWLARLRQDSARGQPAPPGYRYHRPLLPASSRSADTDRGDGRCHGRLGAGRQGQIHWALRGRVRHTAAGHGHPSCHRVAIGILPVEPRPRG